MADVGGVGPSGCARADVTGGGVGGNDSSTAFSLDILLLEVMACAPSSASLAGSLPVVVVVTSSTSVIGLVVVAKVSVMVIGASPPIPRISFSSREKSVVIVRSSKSGNKTDRIQRIRCSRCCPIIQIFCIIVLTGIFTSNHQFERPLTKPYCSDFYVESSKNDTYIQLYT
jgi:hypothetical protein